MFSELPATPNFPEQEESMLAFWARENIFQKSLEQTKGGTPYVFFEGPPTANGKPGIHHVLARSFKDLYPRFHTMKGEHVARKAGWDTHGLPVELEVEKKLGFKGKKDIEQYGIAEFNQKCRESVFEYLEQWQTLTARMGYWLDMDHPYVTMDTDYIYSCWWHFKQMYDKGLVYEDYKVVPYCPRCGTPLSSHEVALEYVDVEDTSVFIAFRVTSVPEALSLPQDGPVSLLAWTTTPWTLPGNVALAVSPDSTYALLTFEGKDGYFIAAPDAIRKNLPEHPFTLLSEFRGSELAGARYEPLYPFCPKNEHSHAVLAADFVTLTDGTGIVHTAVMYGQDDFEFGERNGLPKEHTVDEHGCFVSSVTPFVGQRVKDAEAAILEGLTQSGAVFHELPYLHSYPHCWRCHGPLLYYAFATWFIRTTALKQELIAANRTVGWQPEHIKEGRMGSWLEGMIDWAISRNRYWGTPLPLWRCSECGKVECVGGKDDFIRLGLPESGIPDDIHRPYIDDVTFTCGECSGTLTRIEHVMDVWFDSGAMPAAQWGYPAVEGSAEKFSLAGTADFISEGLDQTRGWFYTLLTVNMLTFNHLAYRNVVCLGMVLDEKGKKMSKHIGNVVDPFEVASTVGMDAARWYFYSVTTPGNEYRFSSDLAKEVVRRFFIPLWNVTRFTLSAANRVGWEHDAGGTSSAHPLDRWLLARLSETTRLVTRSLDQYDAYTACTELERFVQDFSTWYIRRSRDRIDAGGADAQAFCATSYESIRTLSRLLAPFTPFFAEMLHTALQQSDPLSVHLASWPTASESASPEEDAVLRAMALARTLVEAGHSARKSANVKVRQPLASLQCRVPVGHEELLSAEVQQIVLDELNIKSLTITGDAAITEPTVVLDTVLTPELQAEGEARELARAIQILRKEQGCAVDDKVAVSAPSWPAAWESYITQKTNAVSLTRGEVLSVTRVS